MYSPVDKYKNPAILSLKEMLGVIVVFPFVLYLLFPKGDIEQLFEGKNEHTNLSINYLESMLLYHPDNVKLQLLLIKKYDFINKTEEALRLTEKIIDTTQDKKLLTQLYRTRYMLEKDIYYRTQDKKLLKELKARLLEYFNYIEGEKDYLFFFAEATNIDYKSLKYTALQGFMKQRPALIDYEIEKMNYNLASFLGYKEDAYKNLIKLLKYPEISEELRDYALNSLIDRKEYREASQRIHKLFLNAKDENELTKFFYLNLYALSLDPYKRLGSIRQLIQEYSQRKDLYDNDIYFILNTLLQQGRTKDATHFAMQEFKNTPELFDEAILKLALNACTYNSKLQSALTLALFAHKKFKKQSYLDTSIQLALWSGKNKQAVELNYQGYLEYKDKKYETYILKRTTLNDAYAILGPIYRKKIKKGNYSFVSKLAQYYEYTGEIPQGEAYFTKIMRQKKKKSLHYYAILFSYYNNHFQKGVDLYTQYKSLYGSDKKLQEESIKAFIVLKKFDEAYRLSKSIETKNSPHHKKLIGDLATNEKDYSYLYEKLFKKERENQLTAGGYYELIQLERTLNKGKKLSYLYRRSWEKSGNTYMLFPRLYTLIKEKDYHEFEKTINSFSEATQEKLSKNMEYLTLINNYYTSTKQIQNTLENYKKIFNLEPKGKQHHQNYLWFLMDNKLKSKLKEELTLLEKTPLLRKEIGFPAVIGAMVVHKQKLANSWLTPLRKNEPTNAEYRELYNQMKVQEEQHLRNIYDKMQKNYYTDSELLFKHKNISSRFTRTEKRLNYRWLRYKNISSSLSLADIFYQKSPHDGHHRQVVFSLKNSKKALLWNFKLEGNHKVDDFMGASLSFDYLVGNSTLHFQAKYQNSTQLTPTLELTAMEDSVNISIHHPINQRLILGASFTKSEFKEQNGHYLGEMEQKQLTANYTLRQGYPNINVGAYINDNYFSRSIANDFIELGTELNIGTNAKKQINKDWRPFTTMRLSVDDSNHIGTSLSLGISETLTGSDSLGVSFDYSKGIGVINEPTYGVSLNYKF